MGLRLRNEFIFGMSMELRILRGSCKVSEAQNDSMNITKIEFIAYIYI